MRKIVNTSLVCLLLLFSHMGLAGLDLQRLDGSAVNLDQYTGDGKWLLVMIWATNCHICKEQKPKISAFHDKYKDDNAHVLGIAIDGMGKVDKIEQYIADHKPTFPSLVGEFFAVGSYFEHITEESLRGTPTYMLFNPEGEMLAINPGPMRIEALEDYIAKKSG